MTIHSAFARFGRARSPGLASRRRKRHAHQHEHCKYELLIHLIPPSVWCISPELATLPIQRPNSIRHKRAPLARFAIFYHFKQGKTCLIPLCVPNDGHSTRSRPAERSGTSTMKDSPACEKSGSRSWKMPPCSTCRQNFLYKTGRRHIPNAPVDSTAAGRWRIFLPEYRRPT